MNQAVSFGTQLRRWRMVQDVSLAELARRTHYSKGYLSKIETGRRQPTEQLARQCDAALAAAGALAALVREPPAASEPTCPQGGPDFTWSLRLEPDGSVWFQPLDRRTVLAGGAAVLAFGAGAVVPRVSGPRQPPTLDVFGRVFDELRVLGQHTSPADLLPTLMAQTHTLQRIARSAAGHTRIDALRLAGRFAEYTGWMAQEAGDDRTAMWWTDLAAELADAGGDQEMAAYAMVRHALCALYARDPEATLQLADQARRTARSRRVRGLAAQRVAQGYALAGRELDCLRALDEAEADLAMAMPDAGAALGSITVANPAVLTRGWCLLDLGRPAAAASILDDNLRGVDGAAKRFRARWGARRALAFAMAGEADRAAALVPEVLDDLSATESATVRVDVRSLTRTLSRWLDYPPVRRVFPELSAALHAPVG